MSGRRRIVLLGMMSKAPVAGVVWQTLQYLVGLERLGYETYYVEAHARTPTTLMRADSDNSSALAARFIERMCGRFGFGDRWAFHALHHDGRVYGMDEHALKELYRSAELLINLHGGTVPRAEHVETGRLVYVETDPVELQVQLAERQPETIQFLEPHRAFFSFGENLNGPDCGLPRWDRYEFLPTRQPVVLDFWRGRGGSPGELYTTVGNWRQLWREVQIGHELYSWSKHEEFMKVLDLPRIAGERFELALASIDDEDRALLREHGWRLRDVRALSNDLDTYRDYLAGSRAEFTVAKDQNVRLRTGWFSDRSATYLAAGRPVITQDTGFGVALPTGEGLFAFSTLDDVIAAVEQVEADYGRHARAASEIAHEYFDAEKVLGRLLDGVGLAPFPAQTVLIPVSRRPTTLPEQTVSAVLAPPPPAGRPAAREPEASVVVLSFDSVVFTRLCLESTLAGAGLDLELIVVDNGSTDGTRAYLERLAANDERVKAVLNDRNIGFAPAINQGVAYARGRRLVLLNNDVLVPPGALARLLRHLDDESVGLVGPVSNEAATEAEVDAEYVTYGELLAAAEKRAEVHAGELLDLPMLTMFCVALRRDLYDLVGPLDERFEVGLFEDDDYSLRVRRAGFRVACAEDVLVHHFGEGAFGKLVPSGAYAGLFEANKRRFEEKWGISWRPHGRRATDEYGRLVEEVHELVRATLPPDASVLVVSKGDEKLLELDGRPSAHFPRLDGGVYAGHYPADGDAAIAQLEGERERGAGYLLFPHTALWWLDHYGELRRHLETRYRLAADVEDTGVIFDLSGTADG